MFIHIVEPGDTVYNIAQRYNISPSRLVIENGIINPDNLVINDALIIVLPEELYIVREGDTIDIIASRFDVDVMQLLRNNPNVNRRGYLITGEEIVVSYHDADYKPTISINGFAFPYIDRTLLRTMLPFLTYITIMSYRVLIDGTIVGLDNDEEIIQISKSYGVAPILFVTPLTEDQEFDVNIVHEILNNEEIYLTLIDDLLTIVRQKGYCGINIDVPYVLPNDRNLYRMFSQELTNRFNNQGYKVFHTLTPSSFEVSTGIVYEEMEYDKLSEVSDEIIYLLTYDWYTPVELPKSTLPYETLVQSVTQTLSQIPMEQFNLGYSTLGFIWTLPFEDSRSVRFINLPSAVDLAYELEEEILFNENTKSVYYIYILSNTENIVWFRDVRFLQSVIDLIKTLGIQNVSFYNIMYLLTRSLLMYNVNFEIEKIDSPN